MGGRGRGVAAFSFNLEALGITRGSMPEVTRGPKPLFPQTEYKPVPLKAGEDEDYMLALKQEMRGTMRGLPFNIQPLSEKADVERYKEKYVQERRKIKDEEWIPDWQRLPKELMPQKKIIRKKVELKKKLKKVSSKDQEDMLTKLDLRTPLAHSTQGTPYRAEELEKKDDVKSDEEKEEKGKKTGEEGEEEEEEEDIEGEALDEEELEEENDYIASYFEDGDDFGAGSDENIDEATY